MIIISESILEQDIYFHGTTIDMEVGDMVLPPNETNVQSEKTRKKNKDKVFFTKDFGLAKIYAGRSKNALDGDKKYVYEVEPIGEVEIISNKEGATVYMSDKAIIMKKNIIK